MSWFIDYKTMEDCFGSPHVNSSGRPPPPTAGHLINPYKPMATVFEPNRPNFKFEFVL